MVTVVLKRDKDGMITGFTCSGHANYAEKGADIICAGISALTHSAVLSLERLTDLELNIIQDPEDGWLGCTWVNNVDDERADLISKVMLIGLEEIERQYPDYLKVSEVEV